MHSQPPAHALRLCLSRRSTRWSPWLKHASTALLLCGLLGIDASACRAVESLWLDVARSSITTSELHGHVSVLAGDMLEGREAGSRGGQAAAHYVVQRLTEAGLRPAGTGGQFQQPLLRNYQNLLAVLPGSDPALAEEYVLVGAHYDHVGYGTRRNSYGPWGLIHNGADDNASGVAAVLEVIDALVASGHQPRRSILFAFWDGEEKGLLGSKHWKQHPTLPLEQVKLAINVDMVGRMTGGRIEVGGTRCAAGARRLFSSDRLEEGLWLDFSWEYKDNSDHWTFFEAQIPSLYLHTGLHDDYHRPSDDVEKLNLEGIHQVSAYLLEQLAQLAEVQQLPSFRTGTHRENPASQKRLEQPLPSLPSRLDFQWEFAPSSPAAVVVTQVPHNSRAQQAGLAAGDRIVAVNGHPITGEATLPALALASPVELELQLHLTAADRPQSIRVPLSGSPTRLGLSWRSDPAEPEAVTVTRVVPYSPADLAGIQLHDRLYALNGEPITGSEPLLAKVHTLLEQGAQTLHTQVESRGAVREVTIVLGLPVAPAVDATL